MSKAITRTYKGHDIQFDEPTEEWFYGEIRNKSLKAVLAAVDKEFSGQQTYATRDVFILQPFLDAGSVKRGRMTAVTNGERECWISYEDGSRRKETLVDVYEDSEDNQAIISELQTTVHAINMMRGEITELTGKLQKVQL